MLKLSDIRYLRRNQIIHFTCKQCNIIDVEENYFADFTNLKELNLANCDISYKNLQMLINSLSHAKNLITLKLTNFINHCNLSHELFKPLAKVPLEQLWLTNSYSLGIIGNRTSTMLKHLTLLQLEAAYLKDISIGAFDGLNSLEKLYVEKNRLDINGLKLNVLSIFPTNLRYLSLRSNKLIHLKAYVFSNLQKLEALNLSDCKLQRIDKLAFVPNTALKELNLARNFIFYPREPNVKIFSQLFFLQILILDQNNLTTVLTSKDRGVLFQNMSNLRELHLGSTFISEIPVEFVTGLNNLTDLILRDNHIAAWQHKVFEPLKSLSRLDLSNNLIQIFNLSTFFWPKQIEIDLSGNPFNCWCDIILFRQNLARYGNMTFKNFQEYKCGSPKQYENKKLIDIKVDELVNDCTYPPWVLYVIASGCAAFIMVTSLIDC